MGPELLVYAIASAPTKIQPIRQRQTKWEKCRGFQNIPLEINHACQSALKRSRSRTFLKQSSDSITSPTGLKAGQRSGDRRRVTSTSRIFELYIRMEANSYCLTHVWPDLEFLWFIHFALLYFSCFVFPFFCLLASHVLPLFTLDKKTTLLPKTFRQSINKS